MTDYNDGKWHGWNGGFIPVHPLSLVEIVAMKCGAVLLEEGLAQAVNWNAGASIRVIAFRVINAHQDPREWFVRLRENRECGFIPVSEEVPINWGGPGETVIRVREVLE